MPIASRSLIQRIKLPSGGGYYKAVRAIDKNNKVYFLKIKTGNPTFNQIWCLMTGAERTLLPSANTTKPLRWFTKSVEKTVFGKISKICGKNTTMNLSGKPSKTFFDAQSVVSVAQELGVNECLIHKWKPSALQSGDGTQRGAETAEIAALKKRKRGLEMENEILKKAPLIFGRRT